MNNDLSHTPELKLDYKRTFYIGLAFFSILMIWQLYNHYCPIFLNHLLGQKYQDANSLLYIVGVIMAADNLFAIFMLPIFGALSDKTKTRWGRRMPYIIGGMLASVILFPFIAVMFILNSLVGVIVMMGLILVVMNIYRNPAVALMPDITPKPLRSKANGIINFAGYLGAIFAGGLAIFFSVGEYGEPSWNPTNPLIAFLIGSVLMLVVMVLLFVKIKENKLVEETKEEMALGELLSQTHAKIEENKPLSPIDKRNMIILLFSVLFWFVSFNAVETFNSLFCKEILGNDKINGFVVIVLTVSSIVTFLASMNLAFKIGRKNCILLGLGLIILGYIGIIIMLATKGAFKDSVTSVSVTPAFTVLFLVMIAICGVGWALINVNSYPIMVEMSSRNNIGKYTGYYYTFSMTAQSITPIVVGLIMSFNSRGLKLLYPYSLLTMVIALVIFIFFKENKKAVAQIKRGFESLAREDD